MTDSAGSDPADPPPAASTRSAADPLHLGIVIPSLHGGGAEFACRQWITELTRRGHQVTVYVYDRHQPAVGLPSGISLHAFRSRRSPLRRLMLPFWLRRTISETSPAVVLSMLTYSNLVTLVASRLGRATFPPVAVSERTLASLALTRERLRDRLVLLLARRLYRRAEAGIAISHPVALDMLTSFSMRPDRVFVVPNPVLSAGEGGLVGEDGAADPAPGEASPAPGQASPASDQGGLHLLFVGRLVARKRPELFLEVVDQLSSLGIDVSATVVGDGPLRAALERSASTEHGAVTFAGWREPWWAGAGRIDCLVLTSRVEGFANVLVEAASQGIPCVAGGRALGVADAIIPGVTGEIVMADRAADYAAAVLRAARLRPIDPTSVQGWLARFSVESSTDRLLQALHRAIAVPER